MINIDYGSESSNPFCVVICDADVDEDGICDEDEIYGCTDVLYLEYDPLVTEDDGSCITLIIEGCTDNTACNYDMTANVDDNSCEFPLENFDCDGNCLSDINNDGVCDLFGCMNSDACNYDMTANIDDETCEFPDFNFDCDGNCLVELDCLGVCGGETIYDDCGICAGDNTTCLGCMNSDACNYDEFALIDDNSCEFPDFNFDCDGNCLVELDCLGVCGGTTVYDECGECGGGGPMVFYDCDGNCMSDIDEDGVCDQLDNCLEDYNPMQIDNDNDGYGDECSCQYIDINGLITVEQGVYEIYTLSMNIDNMASWEVTGGTIVWTSSTNPPSIGVQWSEIGQGSVVITQYFGVSETCTIELDVTVIPSTIDLSEMTDSRKQILMISDFLGRVTNIQSNHRIVTVSYTHLPLPTKRIV